MFVSQLTSTVMKAAHPRLFVRYPNPIRRAVGSSYFRRRTLGPVDISYQGQPRPDGMESSRIDYVDLLVVSRDAPRAKAHSRALCLARRTALPPPMTRRLRL